MTDIQRTPSRQRGQGLVEFAIVIPIFFLVIFGLFDGARLVFAWNGVSQAARDVARVAAVNCLPSVAFPTPCTNSAIGVAETAQAVQRVGGGTWGITCVDAVTLVSVSGRACKAGDLVAVSATTSITAVTPGISKLVGTFNLTAVSRMEIVQ
jgi:Flp pilus assembly protein TadG